MPSIPEACLKRAYEEAREVAATISLWMSEGIYLDEIPFVLMQLAKIKDYIENAVEQDEFEIRDAILAEVVE